MKKWLVAALAICTLLPMKVRADQGSLKHDLEQALLGKTVVSKIVFGGKTLAPGCQGCSTFQVNTIISPDAPEVRYRVEMLAIRADVQLGQMQRSFPAGTSFSIASVDLKDDRLELKLDSRAGDSALLKLMLGKKWESTMDVNEVLLALSRYLGGLPQRNVQVPVITSSSPAPIGTARTNANSPTQPTTPPSGAQTMHQAPQAQSRIAAPGDRVDPTRGSQGTPSAATQQATQPGAQDVPDDASLHSASVSEDPPLIKLLTQQTLEVVDSQPGPRNTWMVNVRIQGANTTAVLFCSNDVHYSDNSRHRGCEGITGGPFLARLLPTNDLYAYGHYVTWAVGLRPIDQRYVGQDATWVFAVYKVRDSQGYVHEGRLSGAKSQFVDYGAQLDMDQLDQSQDKTDEQAVCLRWVQQHQSGEYWPYDYLQVPRVDCYDHITYTHVILTNSNEFGKTVRGVIVRDNRSSSCDASGCAVRLFYQGSPNGPGEEDCQYCKNAWSRGIDAVGTDMKVTTVAHQGWYDVVLIRRSQSAKSGVEQITYRSPGDGFYQDVVETAKQEKEAAAAAALRRNTALSLGLHSTQPQAVVKAILAAGGYSRLSDGTGQIGPWNCVSDGWKNGQWTTSCISKKGDVTIRLYFELGRLYRNPDTGAFQQVRTDHLLFASFEFEKYDFPDNTIKLVSPTLKKCNGQDDGDGVCFNF